jgi:hypothetical protein
MQAERSAEAIVVAEHELQKRYAEVSQNNEGLNIKRFQMQQGCTRVSLAISGTE